MLKRSESLLEADKTEFDARVSQCIDENGMLNRTPRLHTGYQEQNDDYLAVINACHELGNTKIPRRLLWSTIKHFGFMNNINLGKWTLNSFLIRQPQLLAALISAAFPQWNPLHILIRLLFLPHFLVTACIIFFSCMDAPGWDTDARRLSWHLAQPTKAKSLLCLISYIFWTHRAVNVYGVNPMSGVAKIYYWPQGDNPYSKHWVT